jgi:hypothetical protein
VHITFNVTTILPQNLFKKKTRFSEHLATQVVRNWAAWLDD